MDISISDTTRAFMQGVSAGTKADDEIGALTGETTFDQRLSFYWLHVGIAMANAQVSGDEAQGLFVQGAMTRSPQRRGVLVEFSVDGEEFQDHAEPVHVVGSRLVQVAQRVRDGYADGDVLDPAGATIGRFSVEGV